jgi:hypothetical protein
MKNKKDILLLVSLVSLLIANVGFLKLRKSTASVNDLTTLIKNAKADTESVTCIPDKGDECLVGSTIVPDWDEENNACSWLWG